MNCYHFRATQKSIPDAQELIWLGGGHSMPSDKGLTESFIQKIDFISETLKTNIFILTICQWCVIVDVKKTYIPALAEHRVIIMFRSMHWHNFSGSWKWSGLCQVSQQLQPGELWWCVGWGESSKLLVPGRLLVVLVLVARAWTRTSIIIYTGLQSMVMPVSGNIFSFCLYM